MLDLRPVLFLVGLLICALGIAMVVPATMNWLAGTRPPEPFSIAAALSVGLGGMFVLANRGATMAMTLRHAYVFTFLAWLSVATVGALPLVFSELQLSYTDAFFETMSGVTTTGSTVLVGLDTMPRSILLWRALMEWLGGVGIVVMAIAILPWLRTGGMQLFHAESSDRSDKPMPRLAAVTTALCLAYLLPNVDHIDVYSRFPIVRDDLPRIGEPKVCGGSGLFQVPEKISRTVDCGRVPTARLPKVSHCRQH